MGRKARARGSRLPAVSHFSALPRALSPPSQLSSGQVGGSVPSRKDPLWFQDVVSTQQVIEAFLKTSELPVKFCRAVWSRIYTWASALGSPQLKEFYEINRTFNKSIDEQLVRLVNRYCELIDSGPADLPPRGFEPSTADLRHYDRVARVPIKHLQVRFAVLQQFNKMIVNLLPLV
eukprot:14647_1